MHDDGAALMVKVEAIALQGNAMEDNNKFSWASGHEHQFPEGCRVQIHSLPQVLSFYNGKSARVLSADHLQLCGRYLCEIGVDGAVEQDFLRPANLYRLHGQPSNWCMQQLDEVREGKDPLNKTCWCIGALVALLPDVKTLEKKEDTPKLTVDICQGVQVICMYVHGCVHTHVYAYPLKDSRGRCHAFLSLRHA